MRNSIYLLAAIVAANVAALAIQLLLPRLLTSTAYTDFAVALGYAQLTASLSFDWLRSSVMRFTGGGATPESKALLSAAYGVISVALLVIVYALMVAGLTYPAYMLIASTLLYAVLQGRFDGELAYHRAQFANEKYARLGLSRGMLLVLCALLAAVMIRSAAGVMMGMSLALALATMVTGRELHGAIGVKCVQLPLFSTHAKELATYGAFASASSVFTFAFPAVARTVVARTLSPNDAAAFIFAFDLALKAFAIAGLAINVLILQLSVRAYDHADGVAGKEGVLKAHLIIVASLVFPAVALACSGGSVATMLVPAVLMEGFNRCYVWAVLAAGLLAFRQFAMDPAFFIAKRPKLSCMAPISTLAVFLLLVAGLGSRGFWSIESIAKMLFLSVLTSCFVGKIVSRRVSSGLLPWRPLFGIIASSLCTYVVAAIAIASAMPIAGKLLVMCVIGGISYAVVFVLADVPVLRKKWVAV